MSTTSAPSMVGRNLGPYRVDRKLGQGGMGTVYLAHDTNLQRPVAVKVLTPQLAEDIEYIDRFVREARLAAQVNHANVVQVYYAAAEEGVAFMALELIEGGSLKELAEQGKLPARQAVQIVRDAARGLGAAHKRGIVHRDLKPENILLTEDGEVKLADFGLARSGVSSITQTGIYMGTPHYSSPEQCATDDVSAASDLYSLGVVLYELLSGVLPHDAKTPVALFSQIMSSPPAPLAGRCPELPPSLIAVVDRLLQKRPEDRYPTAEALVDDLERVLPSLSGDGAPVLPTSSGLGSAIAATVRVKTPTSQEAKALLASFTSQAPAREGYTPPTRSMVGRLGSLAAVLLLVSGGLYVWLSGLSQDATRSARIGIVSTWTNGSSSEEFAWLADAIPEFLASELGAQIDVQLEPLGDLKDTDRVEALLGGTRWEGAVGGRFFEDGDKVGVTIRAVYPDGKGFKTYSKIYTVSREHVLDELAAKAQEFAAELRPLARVVDYRAVSRGGTETASVDGAGLEQLAGLPAPGAWGGEGYEAEPMLEEKTQDQDALLADKALEKLGQGAVPAKKWRAAGGTSGGRASSVQDDASGVENGRADAEATGADDEEPAGKPSEAGAPASAFPEPSDAQADPGDAPANADGYARTPPASDPAPDAKELAPEQQRVQDEGRELSLESLEGSNEARKDEAQDEDGQDSRAVWEQRFAACGDDQMQLMAEMRQARLSGDPVRCAVALEQLDRLEASGDLRTNPVLKGLRRRLRAVGGN
ncbi:MAG: protein kinase [Planctomycetes bacterium]|nr:protein kinase [Planctomycetota bacterium]